jgi:diaminohydroxyphosphoribosylaminopyrimidine deaminase/5-amino-6-(5-phosphoribosylamino)uracil reductase
MLRRAGVAVDRVPRSPSAGVSDRGFSSRIRRGRPYVILKTAQTLDGKIASYTGVSRWITGPAARRLGHRLRAESDAVLVGGATVRLDDPALTAHGAGPDPLRIVLSGRLDFPSTARAFRGGAPTWVVTSTLASRARGRRLEAAGAQVIRLPGVKGRVDPKALLTALARRGVGHLLIEGGGKVAALFLSAGLVDEVYAFVAPRFLGGRDAPTSVEGAGWRYPAAGPVLRDSSFRRVGADWLIHGFLSGKA